MNKKPTSSSLPPSRSVRQWFRQPKLGLFLHWGLYSVKAWHEQDQWRREWARADYAKLARLFTGKKFDPHQWVDMAEEIGASYLCLTTKHADGFCLWDSDCTDYKVTNSPLARDVVAELAAVCQQRQFPLFLYYSIVDEHHPAYPHAGRRWEYPSAQAGDKPSKKAYLDYVRAQVRELCTRYGKIHGFWWDANPAKWQDPSMNQLIRQLQPGILINNRGLDSGDYGTPERDWDESVNEAVALAEPTEACQALGSQSWGYRHEEDYYTDVHILRSIAKIMGKGGNYLLNSGPQADGSFATEDQRMLRVVGRWFQVAREAFEGVERVSHLLSGREVLLTRKDARTYYVILHQLPLTRSVALKPFVTLPTRATELTTGRSVKTRNDLLPWDHEHRTGYLRLYNLPQNLLNQSVAVIKLEFDRPPRRVEPLAHAAAIEP